ncbi:MAG: diacylglycerol kinase family protein [Erysipelotrichales bacterium]
MNMPEENEFKRNKASKSHNKFKVAFNGLKVVLCEESSAKMQLCILVLACLLGVYLNLSDMEWIIIIVMSTIVFTLEIMNTAIEYIVDVISPEFNQIAGKIKDIAAGAVLLSTMTSVLIGIIIYLPKILLKIKEII